jgi:hypothetical protein
MLCGFDNDSVMVDYICQEGWTTLNDVVSIGVNGANTFHTVKTDGITFKARPLSKDIRMLKGFLMYYNRMTHKQKRFLNDDDVMNTFTVTDFEHYCTSEDYHIDMAAAGSVSIPSLETLVAVGVFHVESALPPSVIVTALPLDSEVKQQEPDIESEMILSDTSTTETVFDESWNRTLDDLEEYEVVFEQEDVTTISLSCALIADCSNAGEEALILQTDESVECISQWGAGDITIRKMYDNGLFIKGWGDTKPEALSVMANGEQMIVVYSQRMLIAVMDSARVFDPGGQDNKMEKVNQNILVQQ